MGQTQTWGGDWEQVGLVRRCEDKTLEAWAVENGAACLQKAEDHGHTYAQFTFMGDGDQRCQSGMVCNRYLDSGEKSWIGFKKPDLVNEDLVDEDPAGGDPAGGDPADEDPAGEDTTDEPSSESEPEA